MSKSGWFRGRSIGNQARSNPQYVEALRLARGYQPREGTDYSWVADHANAEYERLEGIWNVLDSKADGLIRYMGAGSGVVAFVFTYVLSAKGWQSAAQVMPALAMFLIAMFYAGRARAPEVLPTPIRTGDAIRFADAYGRSAAVASVAAMTGVASVGLTIAISEKARLIRWAFRWFLLGVAWLTLTAFASVFCGLRFLKI